ncbi:MAG: hypothetical protein M3Z46_09790 [Actinomycetota bacterium]|nr:hypothetical protein [Actinomycetota bacterium]
MLNYGVGALAAVALFIWDETLLVAPVIALTKLIGAGLTFLCLAPVYFLVSFGGALLAVRAYERASAGEPSALERWLRRQTESSSGRSGQRLMRTTSRVGFIAASVILGGILTTWLIRVGGRRDGLTRLAAISSSLFAIGTVGLYSGVFGLIFD